MVKNKVANEPLPEIPPLDFGITLGCLMFKEKFTPKVTFRRALGQQRVSKEFGETPTPAFSVVNLSGAIKINKSFNASFGVNNVFNTAYYEHLSRSVKGGNPYPIYEPGRNIFATFSYNW